MSAVDIHRWLNRDLPDRQKYIDDFCKAPDAERAHHFLSLVKAPHGYGVYASIGPNYQYAVFARDSIKVADDLLAGNQALAKEIILLLAHLQGESFNPASEEEAFKIHHEYRALRFNGHDVPQAARTVLAKLGPQWGGSEKELLYYGSFDATPLFIRLVYRYFKMYNDDLLNQPVVSRSGHHRPLQQHVRMATQWLTAKLTASPWQLLEFKRINPVGLYNQNWEDSHVSFLHTTGSVANADDGIAAIELQGYVYDALRGAAEMAAANEAERDGWRHLASIVRDTTLERLWMHHQKYFAMGLDRTDSGQTRQVATLSINPSLLLESDLLSLMPHHLAWPYIEGIVRTLFSDEFLTIAGLRVRGKSHAGLMTYADYHGSLVTWPKATYDAIKGLRKHGFYRLATLLEDCVLHAITRAGEFYEFFFVDKDGRAKYHYRQENPDEPTFHDFGAANLPDPGQAWTISAALGIVSTRHSPALDLPLSDSVRVLEQHILQQPNVQQVVEALGNK